MTGFASTIAALLAGGAVAIGGVVAGGSGAGGADGGSRPDATDAPTALVIDAAAGRDGRDLVDDRLRDLDAEVRLPRTPEEAATDLRYFAAQGYRVVVAGPLATDAARTTGVPALAATGLTGALAATR